MLNEDQSNYDNLDEKKKPGPKTPEAKAKCSMNALKHGLTGVTFFIDTDDIEDFKKVEALMLSKFNPETDPEKFVIYDMTITEWRLQCIPKRVSSLYLRGRLAKADKYPDLDSKTQYSLIDSESESEFARDFNNLTLQQGRLRRHLERRTVEFKELRAEREAVQVVRRDMVMGSMQKPSTRLHEAVGSEFSYEYLMARIEFLKGEGKPNRILFDRTWRDKASKTPF